MFLIAHEESRSYVYYMSDRLVEYLCLEEAERVWGNSKDFSIVPSWDLPFPL